MKLNVTKDDFVVHGLEAIQPAYQAFDGTMYAGRLPANNGNRVGDTMFWMFEPTEQLVPDTLVIWLNGGPGCSSFNCGVMMEHSPVTQPLKPAGFCCIKGNPKLEVNDHAWTRATTMLYVEHPWGTGFSYGRPEPATEFEASGDLYAFVQNFMKVFPNLADHRLYVFGESYAGMFIPSILRYFNNENMKNEKPKINIAGGAMGNGWIDPAIQGPATIDYSWWHGLIDKPTRDNLLEIWDSCAAGKAPDKPLHPFTVQDDCGMMWGILEASGHPNEYDITTFDPNVDQTTFTSEGFYNTPAVKTALHAPDDHFWHGCQWGEGRRRLLASERHRSLYMDNDRPLSMAPYMGELLDAGIPILVYNGDRDMTTNTVGTEMVLNTRLEWHGKDKWKDAPRGLWKTDFMTTDEYTAGWVKELSPLTFAVVYNSGHMVPYNVPTAAYDMLVRFLTAKSFIDVDLPQVRSPHPVKSRPLEWMHLYPTGEKDYIRSFNDTPEISFKTDSAEFAPSANLGPVRSSISMEHMLGFAVGMVVAVLGMRVVQHCRSRHVKAGYSAVPDSLN